MKLGFAAPLLLGLPLLAAACGAGSSKPVPNSAPSPVPPSSPQAVATTAPTVPAAAATPAANPVERVMGTVQAVDGNRVTLKEGGSFTLAAQTTITKRVPSTASELQSGNVVAVTAKQQPDNTLLASAITVLPAAPSSTFFRQFPMGDGNLMTNATIDKVSGNSFTVTFPGGGGQVNLAPNAQITTIGSGSAADITPGVMVSASIRDGATQSVSIL